MADQRHQSDEESHVPSVRSDNIPIHPPNQPIPSETIFPQIQYLDIKPNNHFFSFAMPAEYPIIIEILKGHPISYSLSANTPVPMVYLQQFWSTLTLKKDGDAIYFQGEVDEFVSRLTLKRLRRILRLP